MATRGGGARRRWRGIRLTQHAKGYRVEDYKKRFWDTRNCGGSEKPEIRTLRRDLARGVREKTHVGRED
jgi:hypothetical protein